MGAFGSTLLSSYTAVGTPVNVTARLRGEAEAGSILCSFATHALIQDRVTTEGQGAQQLRGIARAMESYQIMDLSHNRAMAADLSA